MIPVIGLEPTEMITGKNGSSLFRDGFNHICVRMNDESILIPPTPYGRDTRVYITVVYSVTRGRILEVDLSEQINRAKKELGIKMIDILVINITDIDTLSDLLDIWQIFHGKARHQDDVGYIGISVHDMTKQLVNRLIDIENKPSVVHVDPVHHASITCNIDSIRRLISNEISVLYSLDDAYNIDDVFEKVAKKRSATIEQAFIRWVTQELGIKILFKVNRKTTKNILKRNFTSIHNFCISVSDNDFIKKELYRYHQD